ncbi:MULTISPECIES: hypothetical protein [Anaeromyxobacter]|uniref:hypothetical protein n=1 Tax=Anaeromyxobacter TaxID=161492 RepID=UPI001F57CD28|nr:MULTISPECIES: hypothetical protein [unclassified Anaeromyxobacter]
MATRTKRESTALDELKAVRGALLELARALLNAATTTLTAAAGAMTALTDEALRRVRTSTRKKTA